MSLNKVMIIGNVGRAPEIHGNVCKFSVATTDVWNDRASGERKERTEWHRIVAFGKLGETCGRYLFKGKQVYVEGKLQTSSYEKDGITRYSTDIIASVVQFLGGKEQSSGQGGYQNRGHGGGYQQGGGYQNNNFQGR